MMFVVVKSEREKRQFVIHQRAAFLTDQQDSPSSRLMRRSIHSSDR